MKLISTISVIIGCAYIFLFFRTCFCAPEESPLFWPEPPAEIKVSFIKSVYSAPNFGIKGGFFRKIKGLILGDTADFLKKPIALAVDKNGSIYACDTGEPAVYIFRNKEKGFQKITSINKEHLVSPVGIAVAQNGLIFIADSDLKKIFCVNDKGGFKFVLAPAHKFLRPTGLAVINEKLYVVDTQAHSILVFDLAGKFLSRFGERGQAAGKFNFPTAISTDSSGNIYVADTLNFRIQVFDKNNKFLYSVGKPGDSSGSFSRPKGVAVDSFGHIYTTDAMFDAIQIFNKKGELLLFLGETGQKDGEFWIPGGIAIGEDNYIYVADSYNRRIQIFQYVGKD